MKVDTSKLKKGSSELTPECRQLIKNILQCKSHADMLKFLETIDVWVYGKCELYHWIEILDRFDKILEEASKNVNGNEFVLQCDTLFSSEDVRLLLSVLNFSTLLIEHSFSRHLYNSIEHVTQLLSSENMDIVLAVLNLLYMFSKRSNFIPRLCSEKKEILLLKLFNIAERWGDPNYGLALIDCCIKKPKLQFLYQFSMEYTDENGQAVVLEIPDIKNLCKYKTPTEIIKILCKDVPNSCEAVKMRIAHRVRLVAGFNNLNLRLKFVQARLQAISILIYSNALQDSVDKLLYIGFGEELCELIDKEDFYLMNIRAAVLRTLTSMLHFDRNPNVPRPGSRLLKIIQYTGAERQSGILPILVRDCIASLADNNLNVKYPLVLATSLFSLLYHLASYEAGGQALIKSGMMQSLLLVISWTGVDLEYVTFVTRAVRVIDLITNIDIAKFHQYNGLSVFIDRLEKEVQTCMDILSVSTIQKEQSCQNRSTNKSPTATDLDKHFSEDVSTTESDDFKGNEVQSDEVEYSKNYTKQYQKANKEEFFSLRTNKIFCVTQRAALLKSILNFLKKSIQDHVHFNGMRNIMETSLPNSLRHIILNAEFYGPSLFLLATDVVTVYVFNDPSLLSSLQDSGLTSVMLRSLLEKNVPATREVLGSLPNVFSALCLNERGLMEFMSYNPFDKLLKVLLSPDYLVAMRRRRSSDPMGDTPTNLGNAMDDLIKHHPYLRTDAIEAIVRLLHELVRLGSDSNFICWRANKNNNGSYINSTVNEFTYSRQNIGVTEEAVKNKYESDSSGDDEDGAEISSASQHHKPKHIIDHPPIRNKLQDKESIPLIDYILNVMKFIEAFLSNSSNSENCNEFMVHGGLELLLQLLSLPNLPVDSPVSTTAQAVANVVKCILNLAHETTVIDTALCHLSEVVKKLEPFIEYFHFSNGSVLLRELLACPKLNEGFSNADYTPLLHSMSAVHGYVVMLVHLCRNAPNEMRYILLKRWGCSSDTGLQLLRNLVKLYISLVWESTILLSLCSEETITSNSSFTWDKMISSLCDNEDYSNVENSTSEMMGTGLSSSAFKTKLKPEEQLQHIKSLLAASSRLGRALAELFGTLVKLSVGTPQNKQRRDFVTKGLSSKFPSSAAKEIAKVLSSILVNGFCHENILPKPAPKLKLTFLICSVGFTGPMLFDDKRSSFHLMISQFCEENGIRAFFEMFYWALSFDNNLKEKSFNSAVKIENLLENYDDDEMNFPEGSGEFLYAWLQLLEKMVNPRAILESPYAIISRSYHDPIQFEPIFYLIRMHQLALHAIRRVWRRKPNSNYGVLMTTTIITILKHIVESHSMLCERYKTRLNEIKIMGLFPDNTSLNEEAPRADHVKVLVDMGFDRRRVLNALRMTRSLEHATDYLLNHTEVNTLTSQSSGSADLTKTTLNFSELHDNKMDVDVQHENISPSTSRNTVDIKSLKSNIFNYSDVNLTPNEIFNKFCEEIPERIFKLMEFMPDTVSAGSELISVLHQRNKIEKDNDKTLGLKLVQSIKELADQMLSNLNKVEFLIEKCDFSTDSVATKLFIRLKVSNLLLNETYTEFRKDFCKIILKEQCLNSMVLLLIKTESVISELLLMEVKANVPRWLHCLIEFIDSVDNVCVMLQRKANMQSVSSNKWRWYDTSIGKWNLYSDVNNTTINNAFSAGERSASINIGRQHYTVNFNCMTQISEPSGNHRPVLPVLKITDIINTFLNNKSHSQIDSILTHTIKSNPDGNVSRFLECINLKYLLNSNGNKYSKENIESNSDIKNQQTNNNTGTACYTYAHGKIYFLFELKSNHFCLKNIKFTSENSFTEM